MQAKALLSNMILDIYEGCFDRIFIFSPSIHVDTTWVPVKEYIEKSQKVDAKKEKIYFSKYEPEALENIISTQHISRAYENERLHKNISNPDHC